MTSSKSAPLTLAELVELTYRTRWAGQASEETSMGNARAVAELLGPDRRADRLTQAHLDRLVSKLAAQHAPATVARKLAALSAMLATARAHGAQVGPLRLAPPRVRNGRHRVLTDDEEEALLGALAEREDAPGRTACRLVMFLLATGARAGEALGLAPSRVERELGAVYVTFEATKNNTSRRLPLPSSYWSALEMDEAGERVFPITYMSFIRIFAAARVAAGISDDVTPHVLRHTCLTRLIRAGMDPMKVMRWAGHKNIKTTQGYVHLCGADLLDLAEALDKG
jgi:integrase